MPKTFAPALLSLCLSALPGVSLAIGDDSPPPSSSAMAQQDFERGTAAIKREDWAGALAAFTKVVEREPNNANAWNWIGYANRKSGKLEPAFKAYDKALAIDPKHLGAHEYVGEAYLMANNPAKAEEHLATLAKLCNSKCEEYEDLLKAITAYKAAHK